MHFPFSIQPVNDDERFMLEALKEAWKAFQASVTDGSPVDRSQEPGRPQDLI